VDDQMVTAFGVSHVLMGEDEIQISNLSGQRTSLAAHGALVGAALQRFDEPNNPDSVVSLLAEEGHSEDSVRSAISFLSERGYLTSSDALRQREPLLQLIQASQPVNVLQQNSFEERLAVGKIAIDGSGLLAQIARSIIGDIALGETIVEETAEGALQQLDANDLLIICRDYDDFEGMRRINALAVEKGVRAYYARLSGASLFLGPYVIPHKLACFSCYADRIEANTTFIKEFRAKTSDQHGRLSFNAPEGTILHSALRYHLTLDILWNILGRIEEERTFDVREINLATGNTDKAPVLRAPRCEACGRGRASAPQWAVRDLL
jgi:bacteriocin biosynthesis cyclodehydratase domain-containing protein